jgi:hypothetical protein
MPTLPWSHKARLMKEMEVKPRARISGYRFTLKGSPRHYDDVKGIIEATDGAEVYFGEALAYERGAGVALWRVRANTFDWLPKLYEWWVEMERVEPIEFTFHLYLPSEPKYPVLDLRAHSAKDVQAFIEKNAPWEGRKPVTATPTLMSSGQPTLDSH